jgi:hypothetical protein
MELYAARHGDQAKRAAKMAAQSQPLTFSNEWLINIFLMSVRQQEMHHASTAFAQAGGGTRLDPVWFAHYA